MTENSEDDIKTDDDQPDNTTSFRMGSAVMQAMEEKDHYGLYRPIVIVRKEGGKVTRERLQDMLGPLAVYRTRRKGDVIPANVGSLPGMIKTTDGKQQIEVILVWRPPPKTE